MRLFLLFAFFLDFCGGVRANEIDELRTKEDVLQFLIRKVNKKFKDEQVFGLKPGWDGTSLPEWFYKV